MVKRREASFDSEVERLARLREQADSLKNGLVARIKSGQGTGNVVKDATYVWNGFPLNQDAFDRYSALMDELSSKEGETVLIMGKREEDNRRYMVEEHCFGAKGVRGLAPHRDTHTVYTLFLGLSHPSVDLERGIVVSKDLHLKSHGAHMPGTWGKYNEDLVLRPHEILGYSGIVGHKTWAVGESKTREALHKEFGTFGGKFYESGLELLRTK